MHDGIARTISVRLESCYLKCAKGFYHNSILQIVNFKWEKVDEKNYNK